MVISFVVAVYFQFFYPGELAAWAELLIGVGITTVGWVSGTTWYRISCSWQKGWAAVCPLVLSFQVKK